MVPPWLQDYSSLVRDGRWCCLILCRSFWSVVQQGSGQDSVSPLPSHVVNSPVTGLQTQLASLLGSFPELGFLGLLTDFSYLACSPMACGNILCQQGKSLNRGAQCLPFTWVSPGNLQKEHFTLRTNFSFVFSPGPEPKGWVCPHSEWVFLARLPFLKTLSQTHPKVFLLVILNPAMLTIKVNDQKPQLENNLNVHSQTVG